MVPSWSEPPTSDGVRRTASDAFIVAGSPVADNLERCRDRWSLALGRGAPAESHPPGASRPSHAPPGRGGAILTEYLGGSFPTGVVGPGRAGRSRRRHSF